MCIYILFFDSRKYFGAKNTIGGEIYNAVCDAVSERLIKEILLSPSLMKANEGDCLLWQKFQQSRICVRLLFAFTMDYYCSKYLSY